MSGKPDTGTAGTRPVASVIIPAYNAEATLEAAIASALAQDEQRIEIIVIDDASSDATAEIVLGQAAQDSRVRLIRLASNGGPAAARNRGLVAAKGEWIALLDADDSYAPNRLSALLRLAQAHNADMVADNILLRADMAIAPGTPMIPRTLLPHAAQLGMAEFIERNVGTPDLPRVSYGFLKPLLRTAFLRAHGITYDERNRFAEDYMLYVRCLLRGAVWWLTPEAMYQYTIRVGSLTEEQTSADLMRIRTMEQGLLDNPAVASDPGLVKALRRHKAVIDRSYYYRAFTDAVKAGTPRSAAKLLFESPVSARLIAFEAARQAPLILGKALRGGYRRPGPASGLRVP